MAGTITTFGLKEILRDGLNSYNVAVRALDASNILITDSVVNFGTAANRSISIPQVVLEIPGGETVKKIQLFANSAALWELDVDFAFVLQGTLTLNISFSLPVTSGFTSAGLNYLLGNGLRNQSISVVFLGGAPISVSGSFGTETNNSISLASSVTGNVPQGTTITGVDVSIPGIATNLLEIRGLNNSFASASGTIALTALTVTLTN
jgi:hypothetical protein